MRQLSIRIFIILLISGLLTAIFLATGWELELVNNLYNINDKFSWWMRKFGKYPAIIVSILAIVYMLIPYLRNKSQLLKRIAITWLIALIFGAGLVGGFITVEGFDRPRPRETTLLQGKEKYVPPFVVSEAKSGKSFTSGHAAMGFIFAVPFFALRRRKPKTSYAFLAGGLLFGSILGYTRMVLGAHFITDVIWSAAFVLSFGAIGDYLWKDKYTIKSRYILLFLLIIGLIIIYFNKFERIVSITSSNSSNITINTKCDELLLNAANDFSIAYTLTGYGAPIKNIAIKINDNKAYLSTVGLFRKIHCKRAVIKLPKQKSITISKGQPIIMGIKPPSLVKSTKNYRTFSGNNAKND